MRNENGRARNGKPTPLTIISQSGAQFKIVGLNIVESKAPRIGENPERNRDEFYKARLFSDRAKTYLEKQKRSPQEIIDQFDGLIEKAGKTGRRDLMILLERAYSLSRNVLDENSKDERVSFAVLYALKNYK